MKRGALSVGLARVRARFVNELHDRYQRINELRVQFEADPRDHAALHQIGQIAHKIAGTAATLGFPELGERAALVDDLIQRSHDGAVKNEQLLSGPIDSLHIAMQGVLSLDETNPPSNFSTGRPGKPGPGLR